MASLPAVGSPAPDFTLASTSDTDVTVSQFRGRNVLLAFFPLAFTKTCTQEMCAFSEDFGRFQSADTVVLPISVDSVPTLKEFKDKHQMHVDLVSDFSRDISRAYGVLIADRFFSARAYFLIDGTGVISWAHVETNPGLKRTNAEIFEQIAAVAV